VQKAEPIEMPFGLWARMPYRNHVLDGGLREVLRDVAMATIFVFYVHWRNLANTTEPFVFVGDAALSNYFDHLLAMLVV